MLNAVSPLREPSLEGESRLCRHFGTCGGCSFQDRPYEQQLQEKAREIARVVEPFSPGQIAAIRPSPEVFYYRNKMEFAFAPPLASEPKVPPIGGQASGGVAPAQPPHLSPLPPEGERKVKETARLGDGSVRLGLREKDRFDRLVDLQECFLLSPETPRLLEAVRRWAETERLPAYDPKSHRGFLRYLTVREGKNTGERMLHFVTTEGELPAPSLLQAIEASGVSVDTVVRSVHSGLSDVARGEVRTVLKGTGTIADRLGELSFRISPYTFFQTNTRGAEVLYEIIAGELGEKCSTLFDFYCGSGAIGLFCRRSAERMIGIESNESSVEDAKANAAAQGATNAEFLKMDAAAFLGNATLLELWQRAGTVAVMDPPRAGLQPKVRRLLVERPVSRWIYVSCNPQALARDLPVLNDVYRVEKVQPVDLFPHTPHVETVVTLSHRGGRR